MGDPTLDGLLIGGAAVLGAHLGQKYLSGTTETPIWTGHIGGDVGSQAMSITRVSYRGQVFYRVYVVANGQWALVAACWQWPEVLAVMQTWDRYICEGGTVPAWLAHNARRAQEIASLEDRLR